MSRARSKRAEPARTTYFVRGSPEIPQWAARSLGALAVAGAFIAAFYALGLAPLRPHEHWPLLALIAVVVCGPPMPVWPRISLWLALAAFTTWQVVPQALVHDEEWQPAIGIYAVVLVGVVLSLGLRSMSARRLDVLVAALSAFGGAGLLFWSGNALFAEMAALLGSALVLAGALLCNSPAIGGAFGVAAVLHPALLAAGALNNFSEVPTWGFAAAALAPLAAIPLRRAVSVAS